MYHTTVHIQERRAVYSRLLYFPSWTWGLHALPPHRRCRLGVPLRAGPDWDHGGQCRSRQTVQTYSPDRQSRQTVQTDSPVSASQDWDHGGQCQSWQSVQTDSPDRHSRQTVQTVPVQTDSPYSASPDWDHGGQNPKKPENYPFLHHHLRLHRGFYRTISHYLDTKGACLEGKEEGEHHNRENQNNRTFSHQYSFNLLGWYKLDRFGSRTFPMKLHHCTQGKILPLVIHQFTSLRLLSQFGGL